MLVDLLLQLRQLLLPILQGQDLRLQLQALDLDALIGQCQGERCLVLLGSQQLTQFSQFEPTAWARRIICTNLR